MRVAVRLMVHVPPFLAPLRPAARTLWAIAHGFRALWPTEWSQVRRRRSAGVKLIAVVFPSRFWPGLADGSVTVAFRRWKGPTVKAGGTLQSPGGLLAIDAVTAIQTEDITAADVRAAGFESKEQLVAELRPEGTLYRIR